MATASSTLSDHLHCSICTEIYTDPVSLNCQHTFCKTCLQQCLEAGHQHCPDCRQPVRDRNFQINRLIRNMADQARLEERRVGRDGDDVCPEHGERLKLFCATDSQLICYICRDGRQHRGHTFKPLKEAHEDLKKELASVLDRPTGLLTPVDARNQQARLISLKREKYDQLKTKIKAQYEEVMAKLRESEEKAMRQIDEESGLARMETSLTAIEKHLSTAEERKSTLQSGLRITDSSEFLQWWKERGRDLCDSNPECPRVYRPGSQFSSPKVEHVDYNSLLGYIKWDDIDKSLAGNMTDLKISELSLRVCKQQ